MTVVQTVGFGKRAREVAKSYRGLVHLTDDKDSLIEIARQILEDYRLPLAGKAQPNHPFMVVMDKLEATHGTNPKTAA